MIKLATLAAFAAAIGAGAALWEKYGGLVWLDAAIAFCL